MSIAQATQLYACIGTNSDGMKFMVIPDESTLSGGVKLYLQTVRIVARYEVHNEQWRRLENLSWELWKRNVRNSLRLSKWMANTIGIGTGIFRGDDPETGDMTLPDFEGNALLSDPEILIMLWDVGVLLVHDARDYYGLTRRPPMSRPDNRQLMMAKV